MFILSNQEVWSYREGVFTLEAKGTKPCHHKAVPKCVSTAKAVLMGMADFMAENESESGNGKSIVWFTPRLPIH